MSALYLDTGALGRILLGEPDEPAITRELARFEQLVASRLLAIELQRLAARHGALPGAASLLTGVALIPLSEPLLAAAAELAPPALGTLDAVHLATALDLDRAGLATTVMTYDRALAAAAAGHGLPVIAPR